MATKIQALWEVVGHRKILNYLERNIVNESFAHAYLFVGPKTVGKMTIARQFANFLICEKNKGQETDLVKIGCGVCNNCQMFGKGIFSDYYLLERKVDEKTEKVSQNIKVEQVRDLLKQLSKRSFQNSYKIVIVPEADCLNDAASNSLLKFLEEPTPKTIIILLSATKDAILPTIISRCQVLNFPLVARDDIYNNLVEKGMMSDVALEIASAAEGRTTLAKKFADENDFYSQYKDEVKFIYDLLTEKKIEKFRLLDKLVDKKYNKDNAFQTLNLLSSLLRDIELIKSRNDKYISHRYLHEKLKGLAERNWPSRDMLVQVEKSREYIYQNVNIKFVLENLFI